MGSNKANVQRASQQDTANSLAVLAYCVEVLIGLCVLLVLILVV
jgi:hypothetical protein